MSDQGDDDDDNFVAHSLQDVDHHSYVDAGEPHEHEPLPYAPDDPNDEEVAANNTASIHDNHLSLPPQGGEPQEPQQDGENAHFHSEEDLYAEATAAAEAAAAASLESAQAEAEANGAHITITNTTAPMDIDALQAALASKEAEIEALKKALKHRDRQLVQQASLQSTTSLIGEAVLAQSTAAVGAASAVVDMGSNSSNAANLVAAVDPNKISNLQQRWKARFQQLVCFKLKHGHCNVPKSFDASLHAWVRKQRVNKQIRDKTNGVRGLTMHQVNSLQALDFQFHVGYISNDDQWNQNYQKVLLLSHEQGHLESTNDKMLNKWMQNQRARRKLLEQKGVGKAKGMTWERVHKLDAINFRWATKNC